MKSRIISLLLALILLFAYAPGYAYAAEASESSQIIELENGYYLVISVHETAFRVANTKTGTKTYSFFADDGTLEWQAVLKGTFTYNGTIATCTASSCTVTVYADNWYEISKTASKNGGTATATVTMGRTFLGITIAQNDYSMTLTCHKDGNLT